MVGGTNSATPNTEVAVAHTLGVVPDWYVFLNTLVGSPTYQSKAADATNIYAKCGTASVTFIAVVGVGFPT